MIVASIFSLISLSSIYTIRVSIFFSSFLCASFAIFLFELITMIDKIHYDDVANNVIISKLSMLMFVFLFSLFVSFFNELMIRFFFLDLSFIMTSYIKLITILSVVRLVIRSKYICVDEKYVSIYKIEREIVL